MINSLHNDLRTLVAWSKEWKTLFNLEKCKVMHLGFNNPQVGMHDFFSHHCQCCDQISHSSLERFFLLVLKTCEHHWCELGDLITFIT